MRISDWSSDVCSSDLMTDIAPEARITTGCTGLWNPAQARAWRRITDFVHAHSRAKIAVQLAHAGRKGATSPYLVNGHGPPENWTGLFRPGERVRLRFINAATMPLFNIRNTGVLHSVVAGKGVSVRVTCGGRR